MEAFVVRLISTEKKGISFSPKVICEGTETIHYAKWGRKGKSIKAKLFMIGRDLLRYFL